MKQILRILSAVVLLSVVSAPAFAQGGGGGRGGMNMEQRRAMMFEGITLSDVQKAKIDTIFLESQKEMQAARDAAGDDRAAMRTKMMEINTKQTEAIKKVLATKEAIEQFDKNMANMPMGRRGGGAGR